jgi:peptidase E
MIIASGGLRAAAHPPNVKLETYILAAANKPRPRVCFVPTASGDEPAHVERFFENYARLDCTPTVLRFFRRTPADLREHIRSFDIVVVGGGNTRSMLAVWREWGFGDALREAWTRGVVLCGSSAGSICWFAEGVTDSTEGDLLPIDCLGFLRGSNCPHYDGEAARRPTYQRLVASGALQAGYAADDGVGLHYRDDELHGVVSSRPGSTAYRVEPDGSGGMRETPLVATDLPAETTTADE